MSVCLSTRNQTRDLYQFLCMLPMAVVRSSSGVVAMRYILPVLWMTSCFFYNGPYSGMKFATKDRFRLNLLICRKVGPNSISYKGHNFYQLFRNCSQSKVKEEQRSLTSNQVKSSLLQPCGQKPNSTSYKINYNNDV